MSIWAIADLHASRRNASGTPRKPMDVFGPQWADHMARLERAWIREVGESDTVIVAGDIDWALRLEDAVETFNLLASLPGRKILLRGNHDYWWSSKTTSKVRVALPAGIELLHNNALEAEGFNVCGAKGSPLLGASDWTDQDAKLLNREVQRLGLSLEARNPALPTIVAMHYPPFYRSQGSSPYREVIEAAGALACVYGHLHGSAAAAGPSGKFDGVEYHLVAGDAIGFQPSLIATGGEIVPTTPERMEVPTHGARFTAGRPS